jgi:hypothetical protein
MMLLHPFVIVHLAKVSFPHLAGKLTGLLTGMAGDNPSASME